MMRMFNPFRCAPVLMLVIWFGALAGFVPVWAIDLERVANLTLDNSLEIKGFNEKTIALNMRIQEKQGGFGPSIGLTIAHTLTDQTKPIDIEKRENDYAISLSQPLYKPGLWHDYQEARLNAGILAVQLRELQENLVLESLLAVMDICRLRSRMAITKNSMAFVNKTVHIQKRLLETGYGARIDLVEAEVELARYRKDYSELETQLRLKLIDLEDRSGIQWDEKDFPTVIDPDLDPGRDLPSDSVSDWLETAHRESNQLERIALNRELNRIAEARGYNNFKPQVDLTLTYHQALEEAVTRNRVDDSSIKLSMSLGFSPFSTYYQIQRFAIEDNTLRIEADKVKKDLADGIHRLIRSIKLKSATIETQKDWKTRQKTIVEMYEKGLKQRHFPFSRFLENSRKYNESQHDLAQTFIDIWEDRIRLLHLSGQLKAEVLEQLARDFERLSDSAG